MKGCRLYLVAMNLLLVLIFLSFFNLTSSATSILSIPNSPPYLDTNISNLTWPKNTNLTDIINLNDYFKDPNNENLTFSTNFSQPFNVNIVINQSTGYVSFYPDFDFTGTNNLTFIASDDEFNVSSNVVFLIVVSDIEAPKWFNASKSKTEVSQNDVITFKANWTDDTSLDRYIFSIEQFGIWVNYSAILFSGIINESSYSILISSPGGYTVRWRFYAYDTVGNLNSTDIFSFVVKSASVPPSSGGGGGGGGGGSGGGGGGGGGGVPSFVRSALGSIGIDLKLDYDFTVIPSSLDVELLQGEERDFALIIKNIGKKNLDLKLDVLNINSFTKVNTFGFSLAPDTSKDILLNMKMSKNHPPGQYIGILKISSENVTRNVPIIVTIKHFDPFINFNLSIPEYSKLVKPGKNVSINIHLSQKDYVKNLGAKIYLSVKDYSGIVFDSLEKDISVGEFSDFFEQLNIPEDTKEGKYLVLGRIEYENKFAIDSDIFDVGYRFKLESFLRYGGIFFIILILSLFLVFLIFRYERDKKKQKLLELYMLLSQLKDKLKSNDLPAASEIYLKIKAIYGEPVPKEVLTDKEFLKKELKRFGDAINNSLIAKELKKSEEGKVEINKEKEEGKVEVKEIEKSKVNDGEKNEVKLDSQEVITSESKESDKNEDLTSKTKVIKPEINSETLIPNKDPLQKNDVLNPENKKETLLNKNDLDKQKELKKK